MGNSRKFKPGRQAARQSMKAQNKQLKATLGYYQGLNMSMAAQLEAAKMERPPDLDEWIESILPDMDEDERAAWDAQTPEEKEAFKDELGGRINAVRPTVSPSASDPSAGARGA